jgi:hypothetical protein
MDKIQLHFFLFLTLISLLFTFERNDNFLVTFVTSLLLFIIDLYLLHVHE